MTTHDTFLALAATAIDSPLAASERGRLEAHLAACPACARRAHAFRGDALALEHLPRVTLPERRGSEILAAAMHPGVVRHPYRLLVLAALLGLLLVGSLAVGAQLLRTPEEDLGVVLPVPSLTAAPEASAAPSAGPSPVPPAIDPALEPMFPDGTRGAFALQLGGALAGTDVAGDATCEWIWDGGTATYAGVAAETELLGESLTIRAGSSIMLDRYPVNRASYTQAPDGTFRTANPDPSSWVLVFSGLGIDRSDEPEEGPTAMDFFDPLGGRGDAAVLEGILAWRCERPTSPPPTPYAAPTPACPAPARAPEAPEVTATIAGGPTVAGQLGSYSLLTCSTTMSVDLVESDPTEPLIARPGQEITIAAPATWSIVHWEGYDAPVAGEGGNVWTPIDLVGGQRTITVPGLGREGDSLLTLELTMRRDDGRVVGKIPYSFLVRVSP